MYRRNKYHNRKVERDGQVFDSVKEYRRWCDLQLLQKAGKVKNIMRQVPYVLLPAQREPDIIGPRGGKKKGKVIENKVVYYADFVYDEKQSDGTWLPVTEDTKGMRTKEYVIKRKLMLYTYGIRIREV